MKHIQFILNEIARRYDQGYADHIWTATQIKFAADYASSMEEDGGLLQLVALYRVMDEEGFSHSERGAILNSDGVLTTENTITMDTTFVGMFAKGNLVRINYSELHGEGNNVELAIQDNSVNPLNPRWGNTWIDGGIRVCF